MIRSAILSLRHISSPLSYYLVSSHLTRIFFPSLYFFPLVVPVYCIFPDVIFFLSYIVFGVSFGSVCVCVCVCVCELHPNYVTINVFLYLINGMAYKSFPFSDINNFLFSLSLFLFLSYTTSFFFFPSI